MKFYRCPVCGNVICFIDGNAQLMKCCGKEMEELKANVNEASLEKHIPVYERSGDVIKVKVGEVEHPMLDEHYIAFIAQVVGNNVNIVKLTPQDSPEATFPYIKGSKIYGYCNIHKLWACDVE